MPINLQNPENIATGWAPAAQFQAPSLAAVLQERQAQQALIQKSISDAVKNIQTQQESGQYGQALQNAGLVYPGDVSRLSSDQLTRLAQLTQDNTPDTGEDAHLAAQTKEANAKAALYDKYRTQGVGDDGEDQPTTWTDPNTGQVWRKSYGPQGRENWYPVKSPTATKPQTQGDLKNELANIGITGEDIRTPARQHGFLPSGEPVPPNRPWTDASRIDITPDAGGAPVPLTIQKFRQLKKALGYPDPDPTPMPSPTPGATPGQTPGGASPIPTGTPRSTPIPSDQAGGHAPNYGVPPSGGGAQTGDLVPGKSRRFVNGKWWIWNGNQWTPE